MKNKKVLIPIIASLVTVLVLGGVSYAFYSARIKENNKTETVIISNELNLIFTGTNEINANNMIPGDSFTKSFTVENTSNRTVNFNIYLQNVTNEFNEDLVYIIEDETGIVAEETPLPVTNKDKSYLKTRISIEANTKKAYTLKVTFKNTDVPQNDYQGKIFKGTVGVDTTNEKSNYVLSGTIKKVNDASSEIITSGNLVFYSEKQIVSISENGTFIVKNIETGAHNVYFVENNDATDMNKDQIENIALCKGSFSTDMNDIKLSCKDSSSIIFENYSISEQEDTTDDSNLSGESILAILSDNSLNTGYYEFNVNSVIYNIHLIKYNGNQTWSSDKIFGDAGDVATANDYAKNMVIVKVDGNLTINEGVTVAPYYTEYGGPKGFGIYVTGNLVNNGTIDNSHGAKAEGQDVYLWKNSDETYEYVPSVGASGAAKKTSYGSGNAGKAGTGRQTGGGGSGTRRSTSAVGGSGASGTSYSGGSAGAGSNNTSSDDKNGSINGGQGGKSSGSSDGSGAGNPAGTIIKNGTGLAENGTGGLLFIYSSDFENNKLIRANGAVGGIVFYAGGSSGGGSINIFSKNIINNGTIEAAGGASAIVNNSFVGGKGGNGTVTLTTLK